MSQEMNPYRRLWVYNKSHMECSGGGGGDPSRREIGIELWQVRCVLNLDEQLFVERCAYAVGVGFIRSKTECSEVFVLDKFSNVSTVCFLTWEISSFPQYHLFIYVCLPYTRARFAASVTFVTEMVYALSTGNVYCCKL
jgi:hypothetical protein